nr:O-antigen polymerase [uncultured Vibrio sp.]
MENVLILILYLISWTVLSYLVYKYCGGIKNNIAYFYVMLWLFLYDFLTPLYGLANNWLMLFGNDISDYFFTGVSYTILSMFFLTLGYFFRANQRNIKTVAINTECETKYNNISITFSRCILIISVLSVIIWAIISGYGLRALFMVNLFSDGVSDWSDDSYYRYNYLKQVFEMSLPALLIAYSAKMPRKELIFWFAICTTIILSFGFRYRIIILIFSFVIYYVLTNDINKRKVIKILIILATFISLNVAYGNARGYIKNLTRDGSEVIEYQKKEYNPIENLFRYTRNYISNMSFIKYIDHGEAEHDYGESMFGQIFIRALPKTLFENNEKPFPKSLEFSAKSWNSEEGLRAGEAFTYVIELYFSFGLPGIVFLSWFFGYILRLLIERAYNYYGIVFVSLTTASLFHYVTRGYLPGYLMSYMYMLIPLLIFKRILYNSGVR